MKAITGGLAILAMLAPGMAQAQVMEWVDQAYDRMQTEVRPIGFSSHLGSFADQITPGEYREVRITAETSGRIYAASSCDDDCRDVEISVSTGSGLSVSHTYVSINSAWIEASAGEEYVFRFTPQRCRTTFCFAMGMVFQR